MRGHAILQEQRAAEIFDEVGQASLERLFPGFAKDSLTQATLSAGQSGNRVQKDTAAPAHLGALMAARPRIQAMIPDAVLAGFLPKHPLETRLAVVIETATSTYLSALMMKIKPRQSCTCRRRRRQQTKVGRKQLGDCRDPSLEHHSSASQEEDCDDMDFLAPWKSRLSAPQLVAQLSRLTDRARPRRLNSTLFSKGAWQQVARIEDLCHTQVSHGWLYHLDACAGSVLTPHDYVTSVQKRLGNRAWTGLGECRLCGFFFFWTHSWNME